MQENSREQAKFFSKLNASDTEDIIEYKMYWNHDKQ